RNWKYFEQPIMRFYTRCVYAAFTRTNDSEIPTPTDKELAWMHTEGPEVCWIVKNPDLSLSTPNLVGINDNQCKRLLEFLKKIMKLKENQSLITTIRTSYNEAFNLIHNNNGFIELQRKIRVAGNLVNFSDQDEKNLFSIWKQREQKRKINLMAIEVRNKKQAEKIINQKRQLKSFDFSQ
ncbi:16702_t:CDS:2, partial [Funneliformis caledonium]